MGRVNKVMFFLLRVKRWLKSADHVSTLTRQLIFGAPDWVNDQ
jgi:hypothetical protein